MSRIFLVAITLFLLPVSEASAQGWRGIVPLRSSCSDVKRILGITSCRTGSYDVSDAIVNIVLSDGSCATGWRVDNGSVLSIDVHMKSPLKYDDLHLDETKYKKTVDTHLRYVTYYDNEDEGVSIAVFRDGTVASLSYGPTLRDKALQCPPAAEAAKRPEASIKFDEYESLSRKEEEERLNNFATEFLVWPRISAYVIVYACKGEEDKAQAERVTRIRNYLVSRGVPSEKLTTVDGGHRDIWRVELFMVHKR